MEPNLFHPNNKCLGTSIVWIVLADAKHKFKGPKLRRIRLFYNTW